jgi:mono/diheme cytochrome c family protein
LPRPEWYYIPIFQWLKYWPGSLSFLGVVVVPSIVAFFFASLPFLDKRMERRPWKRPFAVGCYVFIFLALFGLGGLSYRGDHADPGYDAQLTAQAKATDDFMKQPFQPEVSGGATAAASAASSDPQVAQGAKVFTAHFCNACHGTNGAGGPMAPALTGIHKRLDADHLVALFNAPTEKMTKGGMPKVTLPDADMKALVAYLGSL